MGLKADADDDLWYWFPDEYTFDEDWYELGL